MITDTQKQSVRDMRREGLSYKAIADTIGVSINNVKSLCRREKFSADQSNDDDCKYCGKPLQHYPGKRKRLFCSDKCRCDWWNHNRKWMYRKKAHHLICHCCGAEFESYGNSNRKYCGRECYFRSRYGEGLP